MAIQVWALGTYVALFENSVILSGTTYTDSGTYTFHVGPVMSELAGAGWTGPTRMWARTGVLTRLQAVNHGPNVRGRGLRWRLLVCRRDARRHRAQRRARRYALGTCGSRTVFGEGVVVHRRTCPERRKQLVQSGRSASSDSDRHRRRRTPITASIDMHWGVHGDASMARRAGRGCVQPVRPAGATSWQRVGTPQSTTTMSGRVTIRRRLCRGGVRVGVITDAPQSLTGRSVRSDVALLRWQAVEWVNGFPDMSHYEVEELERGGVGRRCWWDHGHADIDLRGGQLDLNHRVRAVPRVGGSHPVVSGPTLTVARQFFRGISRAGRSVAGRGCAVWLGPSLMATGRRSPAIPSRCPPTGGKSWGNTGARLGGGDVGWVHRNLSVGPVRVYRIRAGNSTSGPALGRWRRRTEVANRLLSRADYDGCVGDRVVVDHCPATTLSRCCPTRLTAIPPTVSHVERSGHGPTRRTGCPTPGREPVPGLSPGITGFGPARPWDTALGPRNR